MNFFAFDIRKALIWMIFIALPLLSLNMQRNPGDEPFYKKPFSWAAGFLQTSYSTFTSGVRGTTSMYLNLIGIKMENQTLQRDNEELRATLGAMTELKLENERLSNLLGFKQGTKMELLAAKVIAHDLSPDHYSIRINRGLKHGLKKFQAVLTVEGVVGYVFRPDFDSAQVLVLTDRAASIDALVQRTRARGIVSGKNATTTRMRYLKRPDDAAVGDTVVTSGLYGYFPKGFPIGKITSVKKTDYGISQEATVTPIVNPSNVEEVFIVLNSGDEDFSDKMKSSEDFGPPLALRANPAPGSPLQTQPGPAAASPLGLPTHGGLSGPDTPGHVGGHE